MAKFFATKKPDGTGLYFCNLDSICHAEYDNPDKIKERGTLLVTLNDGHQFSIPGKASDTVMNHILKDLLNPEDAQTP